VSLFPYVVAAWLLLVGLYGIVTSRNVIHLIICLAVLQSSTYVLLLAIGYRHHGAAPIFADIPLKTPAVDPVVLAAMIVIRLQTVIARELAPTDAVRLLDLVSAALEAAANGAQPRIQLELVLIRAAAPEFDPSVSALLSRIERLEKGGAVRAAEPARTVAASVDRGVASDPRQPRYGDGAAGDTAAAPSPATFGSRHGCSGLSSSILDQPWLRSISASPTITSSRHPSGLA